jgi:dimethylargininase
MGQIAVTLSYRKAILRRFPSSYPSLYERLGRSISLDVAAAQHDEYANALRAAGLDVSTIEADESLPDSVFVEDTAVLWGSKALIARPSPPRTEEEIAIAEYLRATHDIVRLRAGAFLEGGDVLLTETMTFVGLSSRTNHAGAEAASDFMASCGRQTRFVPVNRCSHLKSGITYLGWNTVAICPTFIDTTYFAELEKIHISTQEANAANCILTDSALIIADGYPEASLRLAQFASNHGIRIHEVKITEFEKGGGSLTCLSLLWG